MRLFSRSRSLSLPPYHPSCPSRNPRKAGAQPPYSVSTYSNETRGSADSRGEKGRGKKFGSPRGVERRGAVGKSPEHMQIRVSTDATCNVRTYMYGESFRPVFLPDHDRARARAADPWLERKREKDMMMTTSRIQKKGQGERRAAAVRLLSPNKGDALTDRLSLSSSRSIPANCDLISASRDISLMHPNWTRNCPRIRGSD